MRPSRRVCLTRRTAVERYSVLHGWAAAEPRGRCRSLDAHLPALGIQYHRLNLRNAIDHRDEVEPAAKVLSNFPGIAGSLHALDPGEARVQRCLFTRPGVGAASPLNEERKRW